jgi:hypothetical protein
MPIPGGDSRHVSDIFRRSSLSRTLMGAMGAAVPLHAALEIAVCGLHRLRGFARSHLVLSASFSSDHTCRAVRSMKTPIFDRRISALIGLLK